MVFDDSYNHEAWNDCGTPRIVLIFDIWHPDLSQSEVKFLTFMNVRCCSTEACCVLSRVVYFASHAPRAFSAESQNAAGKEGVQQAVGRGRQFLCYSRPIKG